MMGVFLGIIFFITAVTVVCVIASPMRSSQLSRLEEDGRYGPLPMK